MAALLLALGASYAVGSIPSAYLAVRWMRHVDVRTVGSGNVGATNVTRVAGFGAGLIVFLIDVLKGLIVVTGVAPRIIPEASVVLQMSCGVCAVLGHMFPVCLGFRGGKGVATTIGVLLGTMPAIAGAWLLLWLICFGIWRYVSVGSITAAVSIPLLQGLAHQDMPEILLGCALAVLIIVKHRANIQRLVAGTEHRVGRSHG